MASWLRFIEAIRRDVEELKRKLITSGTASTAPSSSEKEQQIVEILKNLATRVSTIESHQNTNYANEEILEYIRRIEADAENTKNELWSIHDKLANKGGSVSTPRPTPPKPVPQPQPKPYPPAPIIIISPTPEYVQSLIDGAIQLESSTSSISYELGKLKDGLLNVNDVFIRLSGITFSFYALD